MYKQKLIVNSVDKCNAFLSKLINRTEGKVLQNTVNYEIASKFAKKCAWFPPCANGRESESSAVTFETVSDPVRNWGKHPTAGHT